MNINHLHRHKAKYYASKFRTSWAFGERLTEEALKVGQSPDALPTNRARLISEPLLAAVSKNLGLSDVNVVAVFPASIVDEDNLGLYRLEFYGTGRKESRPAILMHELDEDVSKAAEAELQDLALSASGL
jgi:hypothetical protein